MTPEGGQSRGFSAHSSSVPGPAPLLCHFLSWDTFSQETFVHLWGPSAAGGFGVQEGAQKGPDPHGVHLLAGDEVPVTKPL